MNPMSPTRTKVIIINGAPQSGKDTFAKSAIDYCTMDESANVLNLSSVDPIKDTLMSFGWDGGKTDFIRDLMMDIKKLWITAQNGPTMFMMNNIIQFHIDHACEDNIIFCHIREPEEIKKLVNVLSGMDIMGIDVMTLFIIRDNHTDVNVRPSDNYDIISQYPYDRTILNDGDLAQFDEKVCEFINELF